MVLDSGTQVAAKYCEGLMSEMLSPLWLSNWVAVGCLKKTKICKYRMLFSSLLLQGWLVAWHVLSVPKFLEVLLGTL